jgi:hypothetical protein
LTHPIFLNKFELEQSNMDITCYAQGDEKNKNKIKEK